MSDDPGRIKPGDGITAKYLDMLRRWILAGTKLAVEAPLSMIAIAGWKSIRTSFVKPFYARLLGVNSLTRAYSWTEVYNAGAANWVTLAGGRSGVNNAFESNLAIDIPVGSNGGAVVELMPGYGGADWRFQWQRIGGPTPTPCSRAQSVLICVSVACCWNLSPLTITITNPATSTTVGTCTTTSSLIDCYNGSGATQGCSIDLSNVGKGVTLQWSFTDPTFGTFSGTFITNCGPSYISVVLWNTDLLPDTLTLTDPDGNAISITRQGPIGTAGGGIWQGSQGYTRLDGCGAAHGFTLLYTWRSCGLNAVLTTFDGFTPPPNPWYAYQINLGCFTSSNYEAQSYFGDFAVFNALPDWTAPTDSISLVPPHIDYTQWFNQVIYIGHPTIIKKGGCGFSGSFGQPSSSAFFNPIITLHCGTWQMFPCTSKWTLTP